MYDAAIASQLQRSAPARFTDANLEDSYYRAHAPRRARPLKPLARIIAFGGLIALILDHVWNYDFRGDDNIVESYISYLRRKIDNVSPRLIQTLRGVGYVLRKPAS